VKKNVDLYTKKALLYSIKKRRKSMSYIDLESVGSTITSDGLVFPQDISEAPETASEAEEMMGVHITDVDDEWWGHLSVEDMNSMFDMLYQDEDSDFMLNHFDWSQDRARFVRENNELIDSLMNHLMDGGTI
tara:strand:+ start:659 stop:1054 length:396 start_codon:yes stop_codon:yes gene_type:complete